MPSLHTESDETIRLINDALHKRDDELENLREQLAKLRQELSTTAAERDHLRGQAKSQEDRSELLRRQSSHSIEHASKPDFRFLAGQSEARRVADARIGRPKRVLVIGGGPAGLISLHEFLNPFNRPKDETLDGYQIALYERRADIGGVWYFEPENDIAKGWHHGAAGLRVSEEDRLKDHIYKPSKQSAGDMELMDSSWWGEEDEPPAVNGNGHRDNIPMPTINGVRPTDGSNGTYTNGDANGSVNGAINGDADGEHAAGDFCWLSFPHTAPRWPSPAYEGLVGNILPPLLEFGAQRFQKPKGGLFPSQVETHEYLRQLAEPLRPHIKTCQEVLNVRPKYKSGSEAATWEVTKVDWTQEGQGKRKTEEWDGVIIAAGAFDHPFFPPGLPGLQPLLDEQSPLVMHAKTYPGPRPFVNQHNKIVIVGNANSANDIAAHLAPLNSSGPVYRCIRHPSNFANLPDSRIKDVPPIASIKKSFDRATLTITLEDGQLLEGITKLIFASGYEFRFQWAKVPDVNDPSRQKLVSASHYGAVPNLHNSTFIAPAPTLAFIGVNAGSTPMPLAEIQARTVARTFYGLLKLPGTQEELLEDYHERKKEVGASEDNPTAYRALHMIRGAPERRLVPKMLKVLEESEPGASEGLFRFDEWRESVAKSLRPTKEAELRRLRDSKVAAGGVDGGIGGILSYGLSVGQKFNPVFGSTRKDTGRGKSLGL